INTTLDPTVIRKNLVDAAISLIGAKSGTAGMVEDGRMIFREYRCGDQWESIDYAFEPGFGVSGHVMQTLKPYISNDAEHDAHVVPKIRQALGFHQLIDVPILNRAGELLGCFEIHDRVNGRSFDDTDVALLEGLAASAAVALENARLLAEREQQASILRQNKERLRILIEAGARDTGIDYFRQLTGAAARALQVKCAFIAEIKAESIHEAHSLAAWVGDDFVENFTWDLAGTPCERVVKGEPVCFVDNVQQACPDDVWLREVGAESYLAIPLKSSDGRVTGHMGVLDDKPLVNHEEMTAILTVLAGRAGMELERMQVTQQLHEQLAEAERTRQTTLFMLEDLNESKDRIEQAKREWVQTFDAVTDPIFLYDADGNITRTNKAYAEKAGMAFKDMIGKPYWQVFPKSAKRLHSGEDASLASEAVEELTTDDGAVFMMHSYAMGDGGASRCPSVHWMEDITERKDYEKKLKQGLEGTIHAVATAVGMRDPYTAGHQRRVADLACAIGREMGLEADRIEGIRMGGVIHDIGKIHLPAEILSKPARLTELEYGLIKEHPQIGYDILKDIDFPWPVADIAHQHHERLDGTGYPQGLNDGQICLEARIMAVADVTEAMSSHRPYRPGLGIDKALEEIRRGRGQQYDADAADACVKLFAEERFSFESQD
ncbi:MAG: GAF domain-containing protein, partial [Mariprofundaceae bacterium]|nr:GAF domain-containing protein [Mariprofundaceae bacterium]